MDVKFLHACNEKKSEEPGPGFRDLEKLMQDELDKVLTARRQSIASGGEYPDPIMTFT